MELKTNTINRKWKNDTALRSFIGCVFLFLIFNYQITTTKSSISALLSAFHPSNTCLDQQPSEPKPEQPSNSVTTNYHTTTTATAAAEAIQLAARNEKPPSEPKPEEPSNNITINHTIPTTNTTAGANQYVTSSNITEKAATETTTTKKKKCNLFEGRWVYDPKQIPSYDATRCPFFDKSLSCQKNGRPESEYLKWRWEATDCDIPLFDGRDMLERLRNKRMVLVGDSLNRNQWESLACLFYSSISDPSRAEVYTQGLPMFLKAKDYNFSLEFYMNPFLVEVNAANKSNRVLVLDKIASASKKWKGADVMVFNSWHWWTHPDSIKGWDVYQYKGELIKEMPREVAFERGMKTWARWIEKNVDSKKTTVFFRSNSASHFGKHWCMNSTQPILDIESFKSSFPNPLIEAFNRQINGKSNLQVKYLNITRLSQYRKDAHPSIYTSLQRKDDGKKPITDCSHWCLPGLPDTWNRLLYASLFFDT